MQAIRKTLQISAWLFIIIIPVVNYYGVKLEQRDSRAISGSLILSHVHGAFKGIDRGRVIDITHAVRGSVWSADISGFKISDPLAAFESTIVPLYFYLPLLLSLAIPVLITAVLGRVYCGWICPAGFLMGINDRLRYALTRLGYNTRDVSFSRRTKYYVLFLGVATAFFVGMPILSLIYPPAILSREIFYQVYYDLWGSGIVIMAAILFIELILSRRWWCRYICPGGALYTALSRFRFLNIRRDDTLCTKCGECNPVCPYGLDPMNKAPNAECDQCSECISSCGPAALAYSFSLPGKKSTVVGKMP